MNRPRLEETGESTRGAHRVSTLMRCPREYGYGYLLGLQPKVEKRALALGTCVHIGVGAYYLKQDWLAAIMGAPERSAYMAAEASMLVQRYIDKWGADAGGDIVSTEQEYAIGICGEQTMTRRLDRVVKRNGRLFVFDIKTAGRVQERLRKTVLDPTLFTQDMVGRWVLAPSLGLQWGGVVLDLVPTGSDDFVRQPLTYSRAMLQSAEESLLYWLREDQRLVEEHRAGLLDPWHLEQSFQCYPQGFLCDFWHLCASGDVEMSRYERKG